jgi:hypothetical protein
MIGDFAPYLADDEMEYGEPKVKQINEPFDTSRVVKIVLTDERAKRMFTRSDGTLAGAVRID